MPTLIFRKADRLYAGVCHNDKRLAVEIDNICQSDLGGDPGDYVTVKAEDIPEGQSPILSASGGIVFSVPPEVIIKDKLIQSAKTKLLALGLTGPEVEAVLIIK